MSDYSPPARRGYTKTGKSLKAVRRYYALKDAARKRRGERSPPDTDDEDRDLPEKSPPSNSKRKRSPDDDKLSKRIAAELKVQQEANEKRSRGNSYSINIAPTERSGLPLYNQAQRGANPAFVTQPIQSPPRLMPLPQPNNDYIIARPSKSAKSHKSNKSFKSVGTRPILDLASPEMTPQSTIGLSLLGCMVASFMIAIIYIITYIFMAIVNQTRVIPQPYEIYSITKQVRWLAISSLFVIVAIPYWMALKKEFRHNLVTMIMMVICTIITISYLIYTLTLEEKVPTKKTTNGNENVRVLTRNPLNACLPITYVICQIATTGLMIKQIINLVSSQIEDKSLNAKALDPQMSQYLSPT